MATITAVVKSVHPDKRNNMVANVQDCQTRQYLTVYAVKQGKLELTKEMEGQTFNFIGTLHPLFDNVKVIATEAVKAN